MRQVYAETYTRTIEESLRDAVTLKSAMAKETTTVFPRSRLGSQLFNIAKMINARTDLGAERDGFAAVSGGFDTHHFPLTVNQLGPLDASLKAFIDELKLVGEDGTYPTGLQTWDIGGTTCVRVTPPFPWLHFSCYRQACVGQRYGCRGVRVRAINCGEWRRHRPWVGRPCLHYGRRSPG